MSEFNPLMGERLAALAASGFESSADALRAVADQVDAMCADLIERQAQHNAALAAQKHVTELSTEERYERLEAMSRLKRLESSRRTIPAVLGTYWGLILRSNPAEDDVEQALFLLARMADDLIQIGSQYMVGRSAADLPAPVTARDAGSRGGTETGKKGQERATSHKEALTPIFNLLRAANPTWKDARLVTEAVKKYGTRLPVLPGERQIANYLADLIRNGKVPAGPKDGRAKNVLKPSA